jgi:anaerobic glycerol-3-phosphate dehydrogenase
MRFDVTTMDGGFAGLIAANRAAELGLSAAAPVRVQGAGWNGVQINEKATSGPVRGV